MLPSAQHLRSKCREGQLKLQRSVAAATLSTSRARWTIPTTTLTSTTAAALPAAPTKPTAPTIPIARTARTRSVPTLGPRPHLDANGLRPARPLPARARAVAHGGKASRKKKDTAAEAAANTRGEAEVGAGAGAEASDSVTNSGDDSGGGNGADSDNDSAGDSGSGGENSEAVENSANKIKKRSKKSRRYHPFGKPLQTGLTSLSAPGAEFDVEDMMPSPRQVEVDGEDEGYASLTTDGGVGAVGGENPRAMAARPEVIHALSRGLAKGQARDVADNLCAYASTKRTAEQTLRLLEKQLVRRPHQAEWVLPLVRWGWGCQHDKYKEIRVSTEVMSEGRNMSDAAVAASANSLPPDWVRSELRCTKASLDGQRNFLDLTRVVHHDGANFPKVGLSECAARVAPLVAARGDADTSVFESMEEASTVSAAVVGTAAYKNAEGVQVLVSWALEALRPSLFEKGSRVYMPAHVAPQQEPTEQPTPPEVEPVPGSMVSDTPAQPQQSQEDATPAQQHESAKAAGSEQLAATSATLVTLFFQRCAKLMNSIRNMCIACRIAHDRCPPKYGHQSYREGIKQ
eukprot:jgi/Undpi1/2088/HiC_scaffold_12.g05474.m1